MRWQGFLSDRDVCQPSARLLHIRHTLRPAQPPSGSLPHGHWGGNLFGKQMSLLGPSDQQLCCDELGAPGVCLPALHTEYHSVSRVVSFPGPTSYSASTFYVPGLSFPFPTNSSILESSVFNDAFPQSPALPNYPIFQAHLHFPQASFQDPRPRALHKCPSLFLCFASAPNPSL